MTRPKKILLTGVFGPFGVDDAFGRKENIMELFHNQVTKAQGAASLRFHHRSFGLYFLAANVDADIDVLDFPSWKRFVKQLEKERYDAVGISFITPNFKKAQAMAREVRARCPKTEIILGGHGAAIEGVEELIPCDHVVKGEGIGWLRRYVGQPVDAPIVHPALPSTEMQRIFGVPVPGPTASLLVPGVGCVNGCNFCCTSHFFGKRYTPYIATGRQLFETCRRIADARGTDAFFVMDENFLKNKQRALELIAEMERHQRFFTFHVFSSAEAITDFGIANMVRLGVTFTWIGFESKTAQGAYEKNTDIDARDLVRQLRDAGISVLGSGILCMEHHTPENIREDIDFMIGLQADTVQFMLYTPLPVTALYKRMQRTGLLDKSIPFEEWHGQKRLNWRHPAFPGDMAERVLNDAFAREYEVNSSSIYRIIETAARGVATLRTMQDGSANLRARLEQCTQRAVEYATLLPVIATHAVNDTERQRALALDAHLRTLVGKPPLRYRVLRAAARSLARVWDLRMRLRGDMVQPKTIFTRFRTTDAASSRAPMISFPIQGTSCGLSLDHAACALPKNA